MVLDGYGDRSPSLPDPPTTIQVRVLGFVAEFAGASLEEIRAGIAHVNGQLLSEGQVLIAIGCLLEDLYIERDGLGGYCSTGRWDPGEGGDREAHLDGPRAVMRRQEVRR